MTAADLDEEESREIRSLITNRNYFGVEEILDGRPVKNSVRQAFHILPELVGGPEILDQALRCAPDEAARSGVKRLQDIFRLLELYGAEDHITFDLSMSGNYGYYTGVIYIRDRRRHRPGRTLRQSSGEIREEHAVYRICNYRG